MSWTEFEADINSTVADIFTDVGRDVTYTPYTTGTPAPFTVSIIQGPIAKGDEMEGGFKGETTYFTIPQTEFTADPRHDDTITVGSTVWLVRNRVVVNGQIVVLTKSSGVWTIPASRQEFRKLKR